MQVKLKSTGRVGNILMMDGEYRVVTFGAQGNECSRTGARGIVQKIHHSKLEAVETK